VRFSIWTGTKKHSNLINALYGRSSYVDHSFKVSNPTSRLQLCCLFNLVSRIISRTLPTLGQNTALCCSALVRRGNGFLNIADSDVTVSGFKGMNKQTTSASACGCFPLLVHLNKASCLRLGMKRKFFTVYMFA
jgi:hypothetical protein